MNIIVGAILAVALLNATRARNYPRLSCNSGNMDETVYLCPENLPKRAGASPAPTKVFDNELNILFQDRFIIRSIDKRL